MLYLEHEVLLFVVIEHHPVLRVTEVRALGDDLESLEPKFSWRQVFDEIIEQVCVRDVDCYRRGLDELGALLDLLQYLHDILRGVFGPELCVDVGYQVEACCKFKQPCVAGQVHMVSRTDEEV